ncbi:hypothetical protein [Actinomadura sp. HBU206391]|uniref:hypothetical protein n=1 Tax=Actinomadura sp. HBU206391 TaxID=2731692 RepID=UPI00164F984F|nr:hypothetical protein [Actinomadura sp. HBU206391]MBC6456356.1 hypothetical protein [Actinomadura sp. HBU206391]
MTPSDSVLLVQYVKALCPQQKIAEYTPDAWFDVLARYPLADCQQAVQNRVSAGHAFVAVGEIIGEVKRIRANRLSDSVRATQPPAGGVDERTYRTALRRIVREIGDGQTPFHALEAGDTRQPTERPTDYRKLRQAWDAEQKAKKEAARAAAEARIAEQDAARAAHQEYIDAEGLLLILEPEAQAAAYRQAREELGPEASTEELAIRAVKVADHSRGAPIEPSAYMRDGLARRGCPNGCEFGYHEPPCPHYVDAAASTR